MSKSIEISNGTTMIDTTQNCVIIIAEGKASKIISPDFGTIEIPFQNRKVGSVSVKNTIKL